MSKKTKNYQVRGEPELNGICKRAMGIGFNAAMKSMMEDIKNLSDGDPYDATILSNNIELDLLKNERENLKNERENLYNRLKLMDECLKRLDEEIIIKTEKNNEYKSKKKENRNLKLNKICNEILIEYSKNKEEFNSININSIVDEFNLDENINAIVGYVQKAIKSIDIDKTINLHENELDEGYRIKLNQQDINNISIMLDDLKM